MMGLSTFDALRFNVFCDKSVFLERSFNSRAEFWWEGNELFVEQDEVSREIALQLNAQIQVADAGDKQVFVQDGPAPFFVNCGEGFSKSGNMLCQPEREREIALLWSGASQFDEAGRGLQVIFFYAQVGQDIEQFKMLNLNQAQINFDRIRFGCGF